MLRAARRTCVRAMATAAKSKPPLRGVVCDMDGACCVCIALRAASAPVGLLWWRHTFAACPLPLTPGTRRHAGGKRAGLCRDVPPRCVACAAMPQRRA